MELTYACPLELTVANVTFCSSFYAAFDATHVVECSMPSFANLLGMSMFEISLRPLAGLTVTDEEVADDALRMFAFNLSSQPMLFVPTRCQSGLHNAERTVTNSCASPPPSPQRYDPFVLFFSLSPGMQIAVVAASAAIAVLFAALWCCYRSRRGPVRRQGSSVYERVEQRDSVERGPAEDDRSAVELHLTQTHQF